MSALTYTRKELRRSIAAKLSMPFFRRYAAGESAIDANSTISKILDSSLTQPSGFWDGHWFYGLTAGDLSVVRAFDAGTDSFQLETPMAAVPVVGDKYEIHSMWNAVELHDAINTAILSGAKTWPKPVEDTTLVVCEDDMSYDLNNLPKKIYILNQVMLEKPGSIIRGQATAGALGYVTAQDAGSVSGVTNKYMVSIYAGTGAGQNRKVLSVVGAQVNVVNNWTVAPDTTSKYACWDASRERFDWENIDIFYMDNHEFPNTLYLRTRLPQYYGMRIKLEYLTLDTDLLSDTDATVVPKTYIEFKALSILHGQKLNDTRADRDLHYAEYKRFDELATAYLSNNAPSRPATRIPVSQTSTYFDSEDPLAWWGSNTRTY